MRTIGLAITLAVMLSTHAHAQDGSSALAYGNSSSRGPVPLDAALPRHAVAKPLDAGVIKLGSNAWAAGLDQHAGKTAAPAGQPAETAR
tara:strand:- start:7140 stop:7406 length:267 start_codon:yes stop_codon:yes gene_type:complete